MYFEWFSDDPPPPCISAHPRNGCADAVVQGGAGNIVNQSGAGSRCPKGLGHHCAALLGDVGSRSARYHGTLVADGHREVFSFLARQHSTARTTKTKHY